MANRRRGMNKQEIVELMLLNEWSQKELARQLDVSETAISRWLSGEQHPLGPAKILLRQFLATARTNGNGSTNGHAAKSGKKVAV